MAAVSTSLLSPPSHQFQRAADMLLAWPADEPLVALVSGGAAHSHNAWSVFARPSESITLPADAPSEATLASLDSALARTPREAWSEASHDAMPFTGGWLLALGYALGACFEPCVASAQHSPSRAPHGVLHWCEDAWCFHHASRTWHQVGHPPALRIESSPRAWQMRGLRAAACDAAYAAKVERVLAYIHAGDVYQANIARRFDATLAGCARSFAHAAITTNGAWFGALMEQPSGECVISMSPELFLRVEASGKITTRPIKGTRSSDIAANELLESAKDAAELAMIVDLMRNDLGRVAEIGSVRVAESRLLETHDTVHHGVAEIQAQLRANASWLDVLRATFPPGSVTGAPKVRAMQIIDELEATPRDFYCGAMGFISKSGTAAFNVAIRTAQLSATTSVNAERALVYHAGCGIVAESDPHAEVAETHAKVRALSRLAEVARAD